MFVGIMAVADKNLDVTHRHKISGVQGQMIALFGVAGVRWITVRLFELARDCSRRLSGVKKFPALAVKQG